MKPAYHTVKFPKCRKHIADTLADFSIENPVHGLFKVDFTNARSIIRQMRRSNKAQISIIDYIVYCLSRAIDKYKIMQGVLSRSNKIYVFDDVDVLIVVENLHNGIRYPAGQVIRSANKKSFGDINREMCSFRKAEKGVTSYGSKTLQLFLKCVPKPIRKLIYRYFKKRPLWRKKHMGTVCVSAVGLHSRGNLWAIPLPTHSLFVTMGGFSKEQVLVDKELQWRFFVEFTFSFDHIITDGAPAARFISYFRQLIENAHGLTSNKDGIQQTSLVNNQESDLANIQDIKYYCQQGN